MASSSAEALPGGVIVAPGRSVPWFQWPPHRPRHCRALVRGDNLETSRGFNGLLIGRGTAGTVAVCGAKKFVAFQWPPHRPRHCRDMVTKLRHPDLLFQWPPHRPRHCRQPRIPLLQRSPWFQWPPHRPRHCRAGLALILWPAKRVSMASSSAEALPDAREGGVGQVECFNGLLIGRGTAGRQEPCCNDEGCPFQWPPHRPRHCRPGSPRVGALPRGVSMASSSAEALPGSRLATVLIPLDLVSMASSSAEALPVDGVMRELAAVGFQWPPHRPRHCREESMKDAMIRSLRFNGLLIGRGTAGAKPVKKVSAPRPFQWPPHRPRHCRAEKGRTWSKTRGVSMASSSAEALPGRRCPYCSRARHVSMASSSAEALPGGEHLRGLRLAAVSMASSSAEALPGDSGGDKLPQCITFQWPPHRPRHCRTNSDVRGGRNQFQWPPHRPRHCRPVGDAAAKFVVDVSMASSSAEALPGRVRLLLVGATLVSMASSSAEALPARQTVRRAVLATVSMASSSAEALPAPQIPAPPPCGPSFNGLLIGRGTAGIKTVVYEPGQVFQWPPHRPRHCRADLRAQIEELITVSMASSSAEALPGAASANTRSAPGTFQWPPHRPRHCRPDEFVRDKLLDRFNGLLIGRGTAGWLLGAVSH